NGFTTDAYRSSQEESMSNPDLKRPYHYFNENQLGIRVGHGGGALDAEPIWQWISQQKESVSGKSLKIIAPPDTDKRQYTFPTQQDIATATKTFVFRDVSGLDTKELARLVNQINTSPNPKFSSAVLEYVALNW